MVVSFLRKCKIWCLMSVKSKTLTLDLVSTKIYLEMSTSLNQINRQIFLIPQVIDKNRVKNQHTLDPILVNLSHVEVELVKNRQVLVKCCLNISLNLISLNQGHKILFQRSQSQFYPKMNKNKRARKAHSEVTSTQQYLCYRLLSIVFLR